jgi:hypothetical protein
LTVRHWSLGMSTCAVAKRNADQHRVGQLVDAAQDRVDGVDDRQPDR